MTSRFALARNRNRVCPSFGINMRNVVRSLFVAVTVLRFSSGAEAQMAAAYAVADQTTGYVLDAYKGEEKRQVASLTKIATGKVVLDWASKTSTDLAEQVVVPAEVMEEGGGVNPMGLQSNDLISYRDLIYAALMQSDNTAATTLAYYVGAAFRPAGGD